MLGRGLGGLEQALLDHGDALGRTGHDVHAVIHPDAAIRPALEARGATWHGLPHLGAWDMVAAMRLRLLLRQLRPDLCIAHGNRAMSLLRQAGADPVIAVLPNYKMTCRGAAAVFYPTLDLKRYAESQGVAESCLYHIPSMVDVPPSPPPRSRGQPPVIGAMGRFVAKKGFEVFIAALGRLRSQGAVFRAVLAGEGPERAALERLATVHGLQDVLAFPGWVDDKPALLCRYRCVLPAFAPRAIRNRPDRGDGASDADRRHRQRRAFGDPVRRNPCRPGAARRCRTMALALGGMIADPERADRLGANAYRHARETFDLPCVAARLDLAVRRVAGRRSAQLSEVTA